MQSLFIQYIFLVLLILAFVMIANRLKVAYPIILVVGGLMLSLTRFFSGIVIDPEMVFFIFLPPLLYDAAWQVSWKEFWKWRRIITSFAFPIVILTSCVVAFASNAIIPGFTLALGFLLGGIVSPPDAVSATTIMRQVTVPKSIVSIIEGESLLNDASSLIVFRFALAAVITGNFHFGEATLSFFLVIVMGILIGLAVALVFYAVHRWLPTTPSIEIVLTLVTPYCMYYAAEHFHYSGVLAVVTGGLFLSGRRQVMLTYQSRLRGVNVWSSLVFVFNGLIFFLIGLQLPTIVQQLGEVSLWTAIGYGVAISFVLIVARFICTFGAVLFTKFARRFITVADPNPGWKAPLIVGWAGMRGVVSLAAALSIPVFIGEGVPFPNRNLILFVTFVVILVTLVLQGLTLPWIIRKIEMEDRFSPYPEAQQEIIIQKKMAKCAIEYLEQWYETNDRTNDHLDNLRSRLRIDLRLLGQRFQNMEAPAEALDEYQRIYLEVLEQQRMLLRDLNKGTDFDEELIRKYLALIDIEELKLRSKAVVGDHGDV